VDQKVALGQHDLAVKPVSLMHTMRWIAGMRTALLLVDALRGVRKVSFIIPLSSLKRPFPNYANMPSSI
jgi:hypothetical protein